MNDFGVFLAAKHNGFLKGLFFSGNPFSACGVLRRICYLDFYILRLFLVFMAVERTLSEESVLENFFHMLLVSCNLTLRYESGEKSSKFRYHFDVIVDLGGHTRTHVCGTSMTKNSSRKVLAMCGFFISAALPAWKVGGNAFNVVWRVMA